MSLFDTYKACQAGQKEKLSELFETEQDGSLSFKDICLKKLLSAVRCTFGSEEKNPQGKHKNTMPDISIHLISTKLCIWL